MTAASCARSLLWEGVGACGPRPGGGGQLSFHLGDSSEDVWCLGSGPCRLGANLCQGAIWATSQAFHGSEHQNLVDDTKAEPQALGTAASGVRFKASKRCLVNAGIFFFLLGKQLRYFCRPWRCGGVEQGILREVWALAAVTPHPGRRCHSAQRRGRAGPQRVCRRLLQTLAPATLQPVSECHPELLPSVLPSASWLNPNPAFICITGQARALSFVPLQGAGGWLAQCHKYKQEGW